MRLKTLEEKIDATLNCINKQWDKLQSWVYHNWQHNIENLFENLYVWIKDEAYLTTELKLLSNNFSLMIHWRSSSEFVSRRSKINFTLVAGLILKVFFKIMKLNVSFSWEVFSVFRLKMQQKSFLVFRLEMSFNAKLLDQIKKWFFAPDCHALTAWTKQFPRRNLSSFDN